MKRIRILQLLILWLLVACRPGTGSNTAVVDSTQIPVGAAPASAPLPPRVPTDRELPPLVPEWGQRFRVSGDFNGDGQRETLTERYVSSVNNRDTNKYARGIDFDSLVALAIAKEPHVFLSSSDGMVPVLEIARTGQLFGLQFLKNEGDLDGDGGDDLSYVVEWADWSNVNTWHLVGLKNGIWEELYSFPIWEWQLYSDKPAFKEGLVRKEGDSRIRTIRANFDEGVEDTVVVDLKALLTK